MIKHIVLWKLKEHSGGKSKHDNALRLKRELERLNGKIPGMLKLEVGISLKDSESSDDNSDVILYSEFENAASLEKYDSNPEHEKIKYFAKSIRNERRVIDLDCD